MKNIICIIMLVLLSAFAAAQDSSLQITADHATGSVPLAVRFSASPAENIQSYAWDFNDDGAVDSADANPSYTFTIPGNYLVRLSATDAEGNSTQATQMIIAKTLMTVSITANPTSGTAPLKVQFTAAATGQGALSYDWDFNNDATIDSTAQNPETTYTKDGTYTAKLTVIDETGNSVAKNITIRVMKFESGLKLVSYFPDSLGIGESDVTFIIENSGSEMLTNVDGRIVGSGITTLSSSKISTLNPGDQDSVTIKIKTLQAGTLTGNARILDKSFPVSFTVDQAAQYNKTQLQEDITALRDTAQKYEADMLRKKADGYIVDAAAENIKSAKSYLQKAQENVFEGELKDAKINADLASSNLEDARVSLMSAQKQKTTILQWMKENALAITAIIAALGALGGILAKVFGHARKFGEKVSTAITEHRHVKKEKPRKKAKAKKEKSAPEEKQE